MNKTFAAALSALSLTILAVAVAVVMWSDQNETPGRNASKHSADTQAHHGSSPTSGERFPWDTSSGHTTAAPVTLAQLSTQAGGQLKISADTREVLDAFLSEHPRAAPDVIAAQFKAAAQAHLSEPALSQATDLMTRYAAYQDALRAVQSQPTPTPNVEPGLAAIIQLQQASALREQFLGNEFKEALYGQEEQAQRYMLARQQILSVQGWSEQQRQKELATLDQRYPRAVIEAAGHSRR